jgi:dienelactone hydrolase
MDENGPGSFEQQVATQIAANNNYIVFVADIFSYDRKDTAADELEELYYSNTTKFMSRVKAAIEYAKTIWHADPNKIALTGFGFGGSGALMYGMGVGGGIDSSVKAIASFYGNMAKVVNATDDMVDI